MRLSDEEQAMLAGAMGEPLRWAIAHQVEVGNFFDAADMVEVRQAHIMADTESLGPSGVAFLESLVGTAKVRIPTITDPRGVDFAAYRRLGIAEELAVLERRTIAAFEALGVMMTNTCINYQTLIPPVRGEHMAFGDTGVVIYSNSVFAARSNFEGGPSALAAGLTGRTPRYGLHLDRHRIGTDLFVVETEPRSLSDWGALGALVGRVVNDYWRVPVVTGIATVPSSDALKQFGAALASFGSTPLFHMQGVTPEEAAFDGPAPGAVRITAGDVAGFYEGFAAAGEKLDVVVFAAPQLSLMEMHEVAGLLDGRRIHPDTTLLVATSPEIKSASDRMGLTARIAASGAIVLGGVCFYQSYAREMAEANGWTRLMTSSAKLVNIIAGYGYRPTWASTARCIDSAVAGRVL